MRKRDMAENTSGKEVNRESRCSLSASGKTKSFDTVAQLHISSRGEFMLHQLGQNNEAAPKR